jgi:hypothetical protein
MLLQLFIIAVIGTPIFGIFDSIMSLYRSISAAGRLPGARKANRFK